MNRTCTRCHGTGRLAGKPLRRLIVCHRCQGSGKLPATKKDITEA